MKRKNEIKRKSLATKKDNLDLGMGNKRKIKLGSKENKNKSKLMKGEKQQLKM